MAKANKQKHDVALKSVGCVSALEFVGIRLSACVSMTTTDVSRILEALAEVSKPDVSSACAAASKALRKKIVSVWFTAPISGYGRVKLVPDDESKETQNEFAAMLKRAKTNTAE